LKNNLLGSELAISKKAKILKKFTIEIANELKYPAWLIEVDTAESHLNVRVFKQSWHKIERSISFTVMILIVIFLIFHSLYQFNYRCVLK